MSIATRLSKAEKQHRAITAPHIYICPPFFECDGEPGPLPPNTPTTTYYREGDTVPRCDVVLDITPACVEGEGWDC